MVVWLIGIAGAGKTTQGRRLLRHWRKEGRKCFLIDGDETRRFFDHDLGFSREDRMANIKRIIFGAYVLQAACTDCIVSNISPFEELRRFARRKIPGYVQIYLRRDLEACRAAKDIYRQHLGKSDLVGIDLAFEPPTDNDLVVEVDGKSEDQVFALINRFLSGNSRL